MSWKLMVLWISPSDQNCSHQHSRKRRLLSQRCLTFPSISGLEVACESWWVPKRGHRMKTLCFVCRFYSLSHFSWDWPCQPKRTEPNYRERRPPSPLTGDVDALFSTHLKDYGWRHADVLSEFDGMKRETRWRICFISKVLTRTDGCQCINKWTVHVPMFQTPCLTAASASIHLTDHASLSWPCEWRTWSFVYHIIWGSRGVLDGSCTLFVHCLS